MARHLPVEQVRPYNATNSYLRPGAMEQPSVTGIPLELDPLTTPNSAPLTTSAPQSRLGEDDHALLPEYQASAAMKYRRIAELQGTRALPSRRSATKTRVVGKRKQRRRENSNLAVLPEELPEEDLQYQTRAEEEEPELRKATFPVPPPESFHRKAPAAGVRKPTPDPRSAQMGHHLVSIKGIQRRLRSVLKSESRTADLVRLVEKEIIDWIYQVTVWEPHGSQQTRVVDNQLPHEDSQEASILELERSTSRLKWWVQEPFTRFLVHLVARLWDVASASRTEADGRRTTTLLRPNTLHTDPAQQRGAPGAMATPPTTEWEASSMTGSMLRSSDSSDFSDLDDGPLSPWQIIHRRGTVSNDTVQSSEDEAEGNATITAAGEPLRRMVSASSDAHSEFGDDEATAGAMAASIERASLYETK